MKTISFLGLGAMGSRMAARLLDAGYSMRLYNRSSQALLPFQKAGVACFDDVKAAVSDADWVLAMLRDDHASQSLWSDDRTLQALKPGAVLVEMSTLSVEWTKKLSVLCKAKDVDFMAAPVLGSLPQAESGQLLLLLGGPGPIRRAFDPILKVLGKTVMEWDQEALASTVKLLVNGLFSAQLIAFGESLRLFRELGLAEEDMRRFVELPIASPVVKAYWPSMVTGNFEPNFPLELAAKDLDYLLETLAKNQVDAPLHSLVHQQYQKAVGQGMGRLNTSAICSL